MKLLRSLLLLSLVLGPTGCKKDEYIEEEPPVEEDLPSAADAPLHLPLDRGPRKDAGPLEAFVQLDGWTKDGWGNGTVDYTAPVGPLAPAVPNKVAAIQYAQGQAGLVKAACTSAPMPDVCAVKELIVEARQKGASLAITPEYGLGQEYLEYTPKIGDNPGTDPKWKNITIIKTFSYQAQQLGMHIIVNLVTGAGVAPNLSQYNTLVAFGPDGKVVATHYKFELFGGEGKTLTPGTSVASSAFQSAIGKVGLLICADIYGSGALLTDLIKTQKSRVIAMSSEWTTSNPVAYWFVPFAKKWGVYMIVSNNTDPQIPGYGGAIITPTGDLIDSWKQASPRVVIGDIPLP